MEEARNDSYLSCLGAWVDGNYVHWDGKYKNDGKFGERVDYFIFVHGELRGAYSWGKMRYIKGHVCKTEGRNERQM